MSQEPIPYAHVVEIEREERARCEDCGARHVVGPDSGQDELSCGECLGDLILVERIDPDELIPGFPEPEREDVAFEAFADAVVQPSEDPDEGA